MKLPVLEESPVSTEGSAAIGQINAARRESLNVIEGGLNAAGAELLSSQMRRGKAQVHTGLNEIEAAADAKKSFTTQEVRDALGADFASLDPSVRAQLTNKVYDPETKQTVEVDREDIPSWIVASKIFDTQSKQLLEKSANGVPSEWAQDFKDEASAAVSERKLKLGTKQLKDFHDFVKEQDTETALQFANAGSFGNARDTIFKSRTMDQDYKQKVLDHIDKLEEVTPVYEALRRNDYGKMAEFVGKLNDPKEFTHLAPQERTAFSDRLQAEIKQFDAASKKVDNSAMLAVEAAGWNGLFSKQRAGAPVSYADIPAPGSIRPEQQKEMIAYVDKLNKGEPIQTDWGTYAGLLEIARDPKEFSKINLLTYRNKLADAQFNHLLEAQMSAKGKTNPEVYDGFQTTDEAINYRLRGYNIDPTPGKHDNKGAEKIGYIKTIIQHELADEQRANDNKKLGVEQRDAVIERVLKREIDPKAGFLDSTSLPAMKAGVPASYASDFRAAVQALDPKGMGSKDGRVKTLETQHKDFTFYSPTIEKSWQMQRGAIIMPEDAVRVWYRLKSRWGQLEGRLRATGGWSDDPKVRQNRLVHLAVQEIAAER